jgi:hypothetical protein
MRIAAPISAARSALKGNVYLQISTAPYACGPSRAGWSLWSKKTVT